jgi:Uma2 family endonuclease
MSAATTLPAQPPNATPRIPPLENGDRLTRDEFERRYNAMPESVKAELIEGMVFMSSAVRFREHGSQQLAMGTWIGVYLAATPGLEGGDNTTVRLDSASEPQPDLLLRVSPQLGGQSQTSEDGYIVGAPELAGEIAASSASYDLHEKLTVYRRNGVREYVVWRVLDSAIDWFVLRKGQYQAMPLDATGLYRSEVFPGLWLDPAAMVGGDLAKVLAILQQGIANPEHALFVEELKRRIAPNSG